MKILYIPLDERPCNALLPSQMIETRSDITLVMPPISLLGNKKQAADPDALFSFVKTHIAEVDALVFSVDMLVYGGLLPSRLHHEHQAVLLQRVDRLMELTKCYPALPVYAFNLIMRTPRYDSSDEEPDYYAHYGANLFRRAWLRDKGTRGALETCEQDELVMLCQTIPHEVIEDYETRRTRNLAVLTQTLEYVQQGAITLLAIPQDDSAEYGYTALDQRNVGHAIDRLDLFGRVHLYPGADETGAALVARAVNDRRGQPLAVYAFFSSTLAPQIVPLYEDRPMQESLRAHVAVVGGYLVEDPQQADLILAINAPGKVMMESWEQFTERDITYTSYRHLSSFVEQIGQHLDLGRAVVLADGAYANGGDYQLITLLDRQGCLDRLLSYKGWNTFCNTLGTSLAQGVIALEGAESQIVVRNLLHHLLDDVCYQAKVRMALTRDYLPPLGLGYFSLGKQTAVVLQEITARLGVEYQKLIKHSFKQFPFNFQVGSPWNRMFEIDIKVQML